MDKFVSFRYAIIEFENEEECKKAFEKKPHKMGVHNLRVKYSVEKEQTLVSILITQLI